MAEFCLKCLNKIDGTSLKPEEVILSEEVNLCEGCGKYKHTVVCENKHYNSPVLESILFPFYLIWQILILPYTIYKYIKSR